LNPRALPAAVLLLAAALAALGGCAGRPAAPETADVPAPWRGPAARLAARGLPASSLASFFNSPGLIYSSEPMAAKLKELHGLIFQAKLTRELQEKLFQLGYDVQIDGRAGPDTKAVISRFQADQGRPAVGEVSRVTLAQVNRAMRKKAGGLRPLSAYRPPPPAPPSPAATYGQFTNPQALKEIGAFFKADLALFRGLTRRFGVPGEVAAAIMWVETGYGRNFGRQKAASMLASMAAASSNFSLVAPAVAELGRDGETLAFLRRTAVERGDWALDELEALLRYAEANGLDPAALPGSIYGALGWGQFMPSNVLKYGADGDGDGRVDVFNKADAVLSIGRFLQAHGWRGPNMGEAERRAVIMKYNRSGVYVNTVLQVADRLAGLR
jgi:membrane-bound lytic murein transglycosylase B